MEGFAFFGCWFSLGSILLSGRGSVKRSVMRFGRFLLGCMIAWVES
jgi:hypothetical protein